MKRLMILLCLVTLTAAAAPHGKKKATTKASARVHGRDEVLFDKALQLHELLDEDLHLDDVIYSADSATPKGHYAVEIRDAILGKAMDYYQELVDSFPRSPMRYRALNNMAYISDVMGDADEAIATYQRILDSDADDKEAGGIGSGIMAEPYANYKNRAARAAASISLRQGYYAQALRYLDLTARYPYHHFCGNEYAENDIYMATQYGRCYMALHQYDSAQEKLLPQLFNNALANNTRLVDLAYELLLRNHSKEELKAQYLEAFKNYKAEVKTNDKYSYTEYSITYMGTRIILPSWHLHDTQPDKAAEAINELAQNAYFLKLLDK